MALREILSSYWSCFQALLFPQLEETIGALGERHQRFVIRTRETNAEAIGHPETAARSSAQGRATAQGVAPPGAPTADDPAGDARRSATRP